MSYGFDPHTASAAEITAYAARLKGRKIRELLPASGSFREGSADDKGRIGQYVERIFGLARSNAQRPDFEGAGIELKVVPMRERGSGLRSKERTNVTMIDYMQLPGENWATATVKKKLEKILFVFYVHQDDVDALEFVITESVLWTPGEELLPQLRRDWTSVKDKVSQGDAHLVSDSDGRVLGAATKGAGGGRLVKQPFNTGVGAKPRAWALKPALTTWILSDIRRAKGTASISLHEALGLKPIDDFEGVVIQQLQRFTGHSIENIARSLGLTTSRAKSGAATIVRRAIGVLDDRARIREFEQHGIEVKTVPLSAAGRPYEAMSFPAFRYQELVNEDWEGSDLLGRLQRLLIIPLIRARRSTALAQAVWGRAFFWSPSADELRGVESEWTDFVARIRAGEAERLPGYSTTQYIHVRPKGRDSLDTDDAPVVGPVVKKSFWLNPGYVEAIVKKHRGIEGVIGARG